jgi:NADPH2:quinone reductase
VEKLINRSKGDMIIDYRGGSEAVVKGLQNALVEDEKLNYAFDSVTDKGSYQNLMQVMHPSKGKLAVVLARKNYEGVKSLYSPLSTFLCAT